MQQARVGDDGMAHWVETCFCATPLAEERPYWEEYFELLSVKDAHNRKTAGMRTAPNRGRAVIVIAPNGWKNDCNNRANPFCKPCTIEVGLTKKSRRTFNPP